MKLKKCKLQELLDGRSQTWLANKVKMPISSINKIVQGKRVPELANAVKIARVFDKQVEEVWIFEEEKGD